MKNNRNLKTKWVKKNLPLLVIIMLALIAVLVYGAYTHNTTVVVINAIVGFVIISVLEKKLQKFIKENQ